MSNYPSKRNDDRSNNQVATTGPRLPMPEGMSLPVEQWRLLTDVIWPGAKTEGAVKLAFDYCVARKLDPFKRPVHIVPMFNSVLRKTVETVWPGIADLQTTAARTGEWAGMDEPKWGEMIEREFIQNISGENERGETFSRDVKKTLRYPEWCSVTVYRIVGGQRSAFTEPVFWEEAYATANRYTEMPNDMWAKRPRGQLHKCAKAAAIRAAFPEETGHDYTSEEMEGKETEGGVVIQGSVVDELQGETRKPALPAPEERLNSLEDQLLKAQGLDEQKVPVTAGAEPEQPAQQPRRAEPTNDKPSGTPAQEQPPEPAKKRSFMDWMAETEPDFASCTAIEGIERATKAIEPVVARLNEKQRARFDEMVSFHRARVKKLDPAKTIADGLIADIDECEHEPALGELLLHPMNVRRMDKLNDEQRKRVDIAIAAARHGFDKEAA